MFKDQIDSIWAINILKGEIQEKNNRARISKTKTYKTVTRRNRNNEEETIEFEFSFKPNFENFNLRLLAKVIDYFFYLSMIILSLKMFGKTDMIPGIIAFCCLFFINPMSESLTGKTVGKLILGLEVIDDFGQKPYILRAYLKNGLQLVNIFIYILSSVTLWDDDLYFHNKKTLTYTIKSKDKKEIIEKIENNDTTPPQ